MFAGEPRTEPYGRVAVFLDIAGNRWDLLGAAADADPPTIYEWAGGRPAFERWFDAFYDLVEADELLGPLFGNRVTEEHRRNVTTWWCEVMGGPPEWGTRLAMHNAQPGAEVAEHAPVPRWGWGVAPPYRG